jgi:hypothetical protein
VAGSTSQRLVISIAAASLVHRYIVCLPWHLWLTSEAHLWLGSVTNKLDRLVDSKYKLERLAHADLLVPSPRCRHQVLSSVLRPHTMAGS